MDKIKIGKRLALLRGKKTQAEVAQAIGVCQSAYAMYETGARLPSDEKKIAIAEYYSMTVQSIFFNTKFTMSEHAEVTEQRGKHNGWQSKWIAGKDW